MFKCEWYDPTQDGMKVHRQYKLVDINRTKRFNKYEPFILAKQAAQVCYVPYPSLNRRRNSEWLAVCKVKARPIVQLPMSRETTHEVEQTTAFQEDEINRDPISIANDESLESSNDHFGEFVDLLDEDADISDDDVQVYSSDTNETEEDESDNEENNDDN